MELNSMRFCTLGCSVSLLLALLFRSKVVAFNADIFNQWEKVRLPGCFAPNNRSPGLNFFAKKGQLVTPEECQVICKRRWFVFAGMRNGDECMCGNSYKDYVRLQKDKCNGMNIWVMKTGYSNGNYEGSNKCWLKPKTMPGFLAYSGENNSRSFCRELCGTYRRAFAAADNGHSCWCGDNFFETEETSYDFCNLKCTGDSKHTCGGEADIYVMPSIITDDELDGEALIVEGCHVITYDDDPFANWKRVSIEEEELDHKSCKTVCGEDGKKIAVIKKGNQCLCGDTISRYEVYLADAIDCELPCPGNAMQTCGGNDSVYAIVTTPTDPR